MIDLHTHILPGVDDGSVDLEMSLAMGRFGVEQGLSVVAATPHFYEIPDWGLVKAKVAELQQAFDENQIPLKLVAGAEIFIDLDILEMDTAEIPTYGDGGKFCLIEFPLRQVPIYVEQVLFNLQTRGITPIIAHPERYAEVVEDPNLALHWINQGCLIQMNAGSILGRFGSKIQEVAEIMLTHHMVHLVGSDAHGSERRRLNLKEAFQVLEDLLGSEQALDLVQTNPKEILEGTFESNTTPQEYRKKKRFLFF